MKRVYLDYAATTPVRTEVIEAMAPYWSERFGNPSSIHSFGREAREAVEEAREKIATLIGAEPEEIIFTPSITASNNLAILGLAQVYSPQSLHLVTSTIEHHAALDVFKSLDRRGFQTGYIPVDEKGILDLEELEKEVNLSKKEAILVSVMMASNEVGTIEPIGEAVARLRQKEANMGSRIFIHTDAATVVEYLPLNLKTLGVDLLSLGAHKFGGPKGVGLLYLKRGVEIKPITFGGHQEEGLWPGTEPVPLIVGMAKAFELASQEREALARRVASLRDKLIRGILEKIPKTTLTGDTDQRLPDIASFVFEGVEGEAILLRMDAVGIAASSGSACSSGELAPSHVLLAMGIKPEEAHGSVRFSLGKGTTEAEIDYVLEKLPEIISGLRSLAPKLEGVCPR